MIAFLKEIFTAFAKAAVNLLPDSPFSDYINIWSGLPYLGYINWLIPVGSIVKVFSAWLTGIALYYVLVVILRWVKVLGD